MATIVGATLSAMAEAAYGFTAPQLGFDKQGNTVFVWQSFQSQKVPPSAVIQARWRGVDGTLKPPETLSRDSQAPSRPKIAVADDGTATMVWTISDGRIAFIQAMRRAPNGIAGPKLTLSAVGSDAEQPEVAADSAGNATFVWKRFNGRNWVIEARRLDSLGNLGDVLTISRPGQDADEPQVAVDERGGSTLVWRREDGATPSHWIVQTLRIRADGSRGPVLDLSAPGEDAFEPEAAANPRGSETFVWARDDGHNPRIQTRRRRADGTLGPVFDLSDPGASARVPQVSIDSKGDELFVWWRRVPTDPNEIYVEARRREGPGTLDPIEQISTPSTDTDNPYVAVDNAGNATIVWQWFDGVNTVIQGRTRSAAGVLGPITGLSAPGANADAQQVAVDRKSATAAGTAIAVWQRGAVIQMCQRLPNGTFTPITNLTT